ncbi:hypothetical protein MUK42_37646 [Musa troglodytarum]|uniref:Secreted protein n=1 Tax=Musa troglodytarum TaxID=320322 RepID=A0A9E7KF58_9LILI|nr:hypothetical protein MUK42_37646 [Musa troglodytarum]
MAVLKLKLLAAGGGGGGGHCHLHVALLWFFLLKLPFAVQTSGSHADTIFSLRLFFFRLNRVLFSDGPGDYRRRWRRALRLLRERVVAGAGSSNPQYTEDTLQTLSILSL